MHRRLLLFFCTLILCFSLLVSRLADIASQTTLLAAAGQQSATVLQVAETRGTIYDRKMRPLTGIRTD